jgi:predicted dehydrogenase
VYEQQYAHLAAAAHQEVPLLISGERGASNIAVIEAIVRSARNGHPAAIGT